MTDSPLLILSVIPIVFFLMWKEDQIDALFRRFFESKAARYIVPVVFVAFVGMMWRDLG